MYIEISLNTCVYFVYIITMKRVNLYLSDLQIKEIEKVVKKIDMNKSEFMRRALDEYIEKMKTKYNIK